MGEIWQVGSEHSPGRKVRRRTLRRWVVPGLSVAVLAAALVTVVRRGEEGIRLSGEIVSLEDEARVIRDRIMAQRARVDSLTSRPRIEDMAATLGLRQAVGAELVQVREVDGDGVQVRESGVGGDR